MDNIETKLSNIKKCPFCKAKGIGVLRVIELEPKWMQVTCKSCGARGPIGETFDECVGLWNAADD